MGGAASVFKIFYQKLSRRRKRDRWVRDDKTKLLPSAAKPKKSSTHQVLPKRIDDQVYDQIQQQDLTRRRAGEPGRSIHEDIHRRQLAVLQGVLSSQDDAVAKSFDSMASWVKEGTDKVGVDFCSMETEGRKEFPSYRYHEADEVKRRAEFDKIKWIRIDYDSNTILEHGSVKDEPPIFLTPRCAQWEDGEDSDYDVEDLRRMVAEEDYSDEEQGEQSEVGAVGVDDEQTKSEIQTTQYELERIKVVINTCSSMDASWCDKILL